MVFLVVPFQNVETVHLLSIHISMCNSGTKGFLFRFHGLHLSCSILLSVLYDQNVVVFKFNFKRLE